jgi:hypothetical protein
MQHELAYLELVGDVMPSRPLVEEAQELQL